MTIDEVRVTILVDNRAGREGLVEEHGFAAWVEAGGRRILFDTGPGAALAPNARALGIDLARADAVVLSHGHYDHTGGLPQVLAAARRAVLFAHPEAGRPRYAVRGEDVRSIGMPAEARAAFEGLPPRRRRPAVEPAAPAAGFGITGPIPRESAFEDTGGPFFLDPDGLRPDPIADDLALWVDTAAGRVVVVGCCHAGLINTLAHVRRLGAGRPVRAVIGGLHLVNAGAGRIEATAAALRELDVPLVVPCHCTGAAAADRLRAELGGRVVPGASGQLHVF